MSMSGIIIPGSGIIIPDMQQEAIRSDSKQKWLLRFRIFRAWANPGRGGSCRLETEAARSDSKRFEALRSKNGCFGFEFPGPGPTLGQPPGTIIPDRLQV